MSDREPEQPPPPPPQIPDFTYDDWVGDGTKRSIIMEHPVHGMFGLHASKDEYAAAVERGEIAFSPVEVKALFLGHDADLMDQEGAAALLQVKEMFPAARVVEVRTPSVCADCGFPFGVAFSGDTPREIAEKRAAGDTTIQTPRDPVCLSCWRDTVLKKHARGDATPSTNAPKPQKGKKK